jgi:hypothetical protein
VWAKGPERFPLSTPPYFCFRIAVILLAALALATPALRAESANGNALPDAPVPQSALISQSNSSAATSSDTRAPQPAEERGAGAALSPAELSAACETGRLRGKPCRVHWIKTLGEAFEFLSLQHLGNMATDQEIWHDLTDGQPFWSTYAYCVSRYRWDQWTDDTPFIVHNIGHPLMGAITSSIFEQNDPKARAIVYGNNGNYWRSRLKAMAFSSVYSAQWKVGPLSEASIGSSGKNDYYVPALHRTTNETGFQDFIITPVYGMGWNVGEDMLDRWLWPKIHAHVKNRLYLTTLFWITPAKSGANILRFKPTYYRDLDR